MGVDEAISRVQYGIDKMKANAEPFNFYFYATLAFLKGILDYTLEEYNSKYSVGIGDNEILTEDIFESRAKSSKNSAAISFIASYKVAKAKLLADPKCGKLLRSRGSRDIAIHRGELPKMATGFAHVGIGLTVVREARDAQGNITSPTDSPPLLAKADSPLEGQYYLLDWEKDPITTL